MYKTKFVTLFYVDLVVKPVKESRKKGFPPLYSTPSSLPCLLPSGLLIFSAFSVDQSKHQFILSPSLLHFLHHRGFDLVAHASFQFLLM